MLCRDSNVLLSQRERDGLLSWTRDPYEYVGDRVWAQTHAAIASSGVSLGNDVSRVVCDYAVWRARSLVVGDRLDACDSGGYWYESTVREVEKHRVLVHYTGWRPNWDEWISLVGCMPRLCEMGTISAIGRPAFAPGQQVRLLGDGQQCVHSLYTLPRSTGALVSYGEMYASGIPVLPISGVVVSVDYVNGWCSEKNAIRVHVHVTVRITPMQTDEGHREIVVRYDPTHWHWRGALPDCEAASCRILPDL